MHHPERIASPPLPPAHPGIALRERVLPDWAALAGSDWVARWNETVGEVVDIEISTN